MMHKSLLIVLLATWIAPAAADIVYMRDGSRHEGEVRQEGEVVFVETADGVVELPAEEVVYISVVAPPIPEPEDLPADGGAPPVPGPGAADPPAITMAAPPAPPPLASALVGGTVPPARTFSVAEATRPESMVFVLMRQLVTTETSLQQRTLEREIEQWQAAAHDRQRRVRGEWLTPGDFTRSRQRYEVLLAEAAEIASELRQIRGTDPMADAERANVRRRLGTRLIRACSIWADDDIRMLLIGITHYQTESYALAAAAFDRCRQDHPLLSAYQQGYGMALMEIRGRELDALQACLAQLTLHPDNPLALLRVTEAMENVPGMQTNNDVFVRAEEAISLYPESAFRGHSQRYIAWDMPGRTGWSTRAGTLPVPPYDRLVYRQGVAVPISADTLMVDREVVRDALEVYILINEETLVPASVVSSRRSSSSSTSPMALVRTAGAEFQPVAASEDAQFDVGAAVVSYGLSIFPEMGTQPRQILTRIAAVPEDGPIQLEAALAAGESAAPLLTGDERLVGFLAGRTNFRRDQGGQDVLIPVAELAPLIERAQRRRRSSSSPSRGTVSIAAEGTTFVVYCISSEMLD